MDLPTTPSPSRSAAIRELFRDLCRTVQWSDPSASIDDRLADAILHQQLAIEAEGISMTVAISEEMRLAVRVELEDEFDPLLEAALHEALEEVNSPLARLVLADWDQFCTACRAGPRGRARTRARAVGARGR